MNKHRSQGGIRSNKRLPSLENNKNLINLKSRDDSNFISEENDDSNLELNGESKMVNAKGNLPISK